MSTRIILWVPAYFPVPGDADPGDGYWDWQEIARFKSPEPAMDALEKIAHHERAVLWSTEANPLMVYCLGEGDGTIHAALGPDDMTPRKLPG